MSLEVLRLANGVYDGDASESITMPEFTRTCHALGPAPHLIAAYSWTAVLTLALSMALCACGGGNKPETSTPSGLTVNTDAEANNATDIQAPPMDDTSSWPPAVKLQASSSCIRPRLIGAHRTYDVGTGKPYTDLNQVPWLQLTAGDVVNIHYRAAAYKTVMGLRAQGTVANPVYINGVIDSSCLRPVIDGNGATMADDAVAAHFGSYGQLPDGTWSDGLQGLGIFMIYWLGNETPNARYDYLPQFITIQNLKLMNASNANGMQMTYATGTKKAYQGGASGIYAVRVRNLTVDNCEITANDNGIFTNSRGQGTEDYSANIIVRNSKIHLNGNPLHSTEHNLYIQARRALYEGNFLGQAYGGTTLKDRGSATVVRYNYIQASARAIDLVDTEEEYQHAVHDDPLYNYAWIYGNIILNDMTLPLTTTNDRLSGRPIHFGHDKNSAKTRRGTLYFYGNTYVQRSRCTPSSCYYSSAVFQLGGNDDDYPDINAHVEASGNIFWSDDGSTGWSFLASSRVGRLLLKGPNYVPENWKMPDHDNFVQMATAFDSNDVPTTWMTTSYPMVDRSAATLIIGDTRSNPPKLDTTTLAPQAGSPILDQGIPFPSMGDLTSAAASALTIDHLRLTGQYLAPTGVKARVLKGKAFDLGAIEQP
jgi:hypothetical protein